MLDTLKEFFGIDNGYDEEYEDYCEFDDEYEDYFSSKYNPLHDNYHKAFQVRPSRKRIPIDLFPDEYEIYKIAKDMRLKDIEAVLISYKVLGHPPVIIQKLMGINDTKYSSIVLKIHKKIKLSEYLHIENKIKRLGQKKNINPKLYSNLFSKDIPKIVDAINRIEGFFIYKHQSELEAIDKRKFHNIHKKNISEIMQANKINSMPQKNQKKSKVNIPSFLQRYRIEKDDEG